MIGGKLKIVFIADVFVEDGIVGGGELNNEEFCKIATGLGHDVLKIRTGQTNIAFLEENIKSKFVVGNFIGLSGECRHFLSRNCDYIIYEHDHKYLKTRNPSVFEDFRAPKNQIVNYDFYKGAMAVFCQSAFHAGIVKSNLEIENIVNLSGNLWSLESLELLEKLVEREKKDCCSVMDSPIAHKNTHDALKYCMYKDWEYELIKSDSYEDFLNQLGSNKKFVFFPQTAETLARVVIEARMMNVEVVTNSLVGATKEPWFEKKGLDLIQIIKDKREEISNKVLNCLNG